ncbi:MAG: thiolase family protein [Thermoanaerobaculia bacterium]|nr:thiolase family protein [Thermoanaerobaculia bacterium]
MSLEPMLSRPRIPYGTWGSSYFPAWQQSALAEVNIGQFAGEAAGRIYGRRRVPLSEVDYLVIGSTVPWHWKFWTAPLISACFGRRVPGYHVEQACATGLKAVLVAGAEVQAGREVAAVVTFDRTSDSPVGVFPERRSHERTIAISDVWDNFGFDPATGKSMIATAGNAARKYKLDRREVDELALYRHQQYFDALESGFLDRVLVPLEILGVNGRSIGRVDSDAGVRRLTPEALAAMRELDSCVTSGTQTHASDGMATLLVTTRERAKELSPRPEVDVQFVAKFETRVAPAMMPEAPAEAVKGLLQRTGLSLDDVAVLKNHNPFAVNDALFARSLGCDWRTMNRTGSSLVWGHPQGPTLTRCLIEGLEEAVDLGGGYVLVFGCAAGDVGIAALFQVTEGGN